MTGDRLSAVDAEKYGLVYRVYDDERLAEESMKVAKKIAEGPTLAFVATRKIIDNSFLVSFEQELEEERKVQKELGDTPDFKEAIKARARGKRPVFTGKL